MYTVPSGLTVALRSPIEVGNTPPSRYVVTENCKTDEPSGCAVVSETDGTNWTPESRSDMDCRKSDTLDMDTEGSDDNPWVLPAARRLRITSRLADGPAKVGSAVA